MYTYNKMGDPCLPGVTLSEARSIARIKLGVPDQYAKKMSVAQVCKAMNARSTTHVVPPMNYRKHLKTGKTYLIDPESPLTVNDFVVLLGTKGATQRDIARIAKKVKLSTDCLSKRELVVNIIHVLETLNISEPIELPVSRLKKRAPTA